MSDIPATIWCVFQGDAIVVARADGVETALVVADRDLIPIMVDLAEKVCSAVNAPLSVVEFSYYRVTQVIRPVCTACNGSGRYDSDGAPPCGACGGTGRA